jgi:predicted kinase
MLIINGFVILRVMKRLVYIFRGAPATGKGTIVPEFCKLLPKPVACIEQDKLRWSFHLIGRSVAEVDDSEHILANKNVELLYEQYLKDGRYTIVLEGLFTWNDNLSSQGSVVRLKELATRYGFEVESIVLKANKQELLERNAVRPYVVPTEEFDMLYENIYKTINKSEHIIDSTNQTPTETLNELKIII